MAELIESVGRIEPARLERADETIMNAVAELSSESAQLDTALHPRTAASLSDHIRIMNCYYSNLIEGHNTRPREIVQALQGDFAADTERRNLQIEATAHIRVQREIDRLHAENLLPEPASVDFILWLHREFYSDAPAEILLIKGQHREFVMQPGAFRTEPEHDVNVGNHLPPSSERIADFMRHFERRFCFEGMGRGARILAIATAHHRFNYIHPFPDGNGRVSRLMSHAMALKAGVGAHGLWSISRGLARGQRSRTEYKMMMAGADTPRQGDLDGRGNLSEKALSEFTLWFLEVCVDQVHFMSELFAINGLAQRFRRYLLADLGLREEALRLVEEALLRGEFERGAAPRVSGLRERSARDLLQSLIHLGVLGSDTPKGPVSVRFPVEALDVLFPRLYPEA
jgi:Fic family protein